MIRIHADNVENRKEVIRMTKISALCTTVIVVCSAMLFLLAASPAPSESSWSYLSPEAEGQLFGAEGCGWWCYDDPSAGDCLIDDSSECTGSNNGTACTDCPAAVFRNCVYWPVHGTQSCTENWTLCPFGQTGSCQGLGYCNLTTDYHCQTEGQHQLLSRRNDCYEH